MHPSVEKLLGKVIISCQAYEDTPLYGSQYMKAMAASALIGGAAGIRACWPQDIRAIRELGDFPIIGINKIMPPDMSKDTIFITPTFDAARAVIEAGCDILALDCTIKPGRSQADLNALLAEIKQHFPAVAVMADCATYEECAFCEQTGLVDILSTTLSGQRCEQEPEGPDIELLGQLKANLKLPVNAEGRIWEQQDLIDVLVAGADMVTIGTAVTRPHLITERFIRANQKWHKKQ